MKFYQFIKCLWFNKALLLGYIIFIGYPILVIYNWKIWLSFIVLWVIGIMLIGICRNGWYTFDTYKRVCNIIDQGHFVMLDINNEKCYCDKAGYKWAIWENKKKLKDEI